MTPTVVLAAGRSSRFGVANKLTARLGERPVIAVTLANVLAATQGPVILVTGYRARALRRALARYGVRSSRLKIVFVRHGHSSGLARSLAHGITAAPNISSAVQIHLADTPGIRRRDVHSLRRAMHAGAEVARPGHGGQPGHPVRLRRCLIDSANTIERFGLRPTMAAVAPGRKTRLDARPHSVRDVDRRQMIRGLICDSARRRR